VSRGRAGTADGTWLLLAVMLVLFALTFPATKEMTNGLGVATTTATRFLIAGMLLVPFAWAGMRRLGRAGWPLFAAGVIGVGLQSLSLVAGIDAGSASLAALILGLEPIGIAIVATLAGGESLDRWMVSGLVVGFAGVAIVSGAVTQPLDEIPLTAVAFLLLTVVTFSCYTVVIRRLSSRAEPPVIAAVTTVGAVSVTLPLLLVEAVRGDAIGDGASLTTALAAAFAGIATAFSFILFVRVLRARPSASFAVLLYLLPPLAVLASWALLGEQPQLRHAVGGVLVVGAVAVAEHGRRRPTAMVAA
jgi:drug/metabolite transporter (DMT)-like permease